MDDDTPWRSDLFSTMTTGSEVYRKSDMASEPERVELWTKATKMWDRRGKSERYLDDLLYTVSLSAPEELREGDAPWTLRLHSGATKTFLYK